MAALRPSVARPPVGQLNTGYTCPRDAEPAWRAACEEGWTILSGGTVADVAHEVVGAVGK